MPIKQVEVPLWKGLMENKRIKLVVEEFAGKVILIIKEKEKDDLTIELYKDDLDRAWNAVKRR